MKEQMATGEDMSEELEDAKDELAAAETVSELKEAADELDRRLSEIEDQEKDSRTLAEGAENGEGFDWTDGGVSTQHDKTTGTTY